MKITIPEQYTIYLQRLNHEMEARKDLLAYMLKIGIEQDKYDKLFKEYLKSYSAFQLGKEEFHESFIKPLNIKANKLWTLNFNTNECEIED